MDEALFPSTTPLPGLVALDAVQRRGLTARQSSSVWDAMICTVSSGGLLAGAGFWNSLKRKSHFEN